MISRIIFIIILVDKVIILIIHEIGRAQNKHTVASEMEDFF